MKDERMYILKMIEDGKISADEGVKLFAAITKNKQCKGKNQKDNFSKADFEEKMNKVAKATDSFAKEIKEKVETVAKDAEPKVKEVTRVIVDRTSTFANDVMNTLKNTFENKDSKDSDEYEIIDDETDEEIAEEDKEFDIEFTEIKSED